MSSNYFASQFSKNCSILPWLLVLQDSQYTRLYPCNDWNGMVLNTWTISPSLMGHQPLLINWLTDWLTDWLIAWSIVWLIDWLMDLCPTFHCMSWSSLPPLLGLVTDPLFTAASGDLDPPRVLAPHPGGLGVRTQGHAPDGPVHTQTLVFTAGLKALPIPVDHTIMLAACANHIWQRRSGQKSYITERHTVVMMTR
jgi:hypothetical protein